MPTGKYLSNRDTLVRLPGYASDTLIESPAAFSIRKQDSTWVMQSSSGKCVQCCCTYTYTNICPDDAATVCSNLPNFIQVTLDGVNLSSDCLNADWYMANEGYDNGYYTNAIQCQPVSGSIPNGTFCLGWTADDSANNTVGCYGYGHWGATTNQLLVQNWLGNGSYIGGCTSTGSPTFNTMYDNSFGKPPLQMMVQLRGEKTGSAAYDFSTIQWRVIVYQTTMASPSPWFPVKYDYVQALLFLSDWTSPPDSTRPCVKDFGSASNIATVNGYVDGGSLETVGPGCSGSGLNLGIMQFVGVASGGTATLSFCSCNETSVPSDGAVRMKGLGDVVAKVTKAVGIKPCAGCQKRQAALNKLIPFAKQPL